MAQRAPGADRVLGQVQAARRELGAEAEAEERIVEHARGVLEDRGHRLGRDARVGIVEEARVDPTRLEERRGIDAASAYEAGDRPDDVDGDGRSHTGMMPERAPRKKAGVNGS